VSLNSASNLLIYHTHIGQLSGGVWPLGLLFYNLLSGYTLLCCRNVSCSFSPQ